MALQIPQSSGSLIMARPDDFAFNEQTAQDNDFMHPPKASESPRQKALKEYEGAVERLRSEGLEVLELKKPHDLPALPDAVFPNNWLVTFADGTLQTFPMHAHNRQAEVRQMPALQPLLQEAGYALKDLQDFSGPHGEGVALEGTGSLVLDRPNQVAYAARSERTDEHLLHQWAEYSGFQVQDFETLSSHNAPFYHTNIIMSIGTEWALFCEEALPDQAQAQHIKNLLARDRLVVPISLFQAEAHFCGNMLEAVNDQGQRLLLMSERAFQGLDSGQRTKLEKFVRLVSLPIPTIEWVGGGSVRCMLAENFLPKA